MASGRGSVQMTEAEIEEFLSANMKVQVATAVNNAAVLVDPDAHVFPGHSSDGS